MGPDGYGMLALPDILLILLQKTKVPVWILFACAALPVAMTLGLVPPETLLKEFSNTGVLSVAVLIMEAYGMYSTRATIIIAGTCM